MKMPFGTFRGVELRDVPYDYLHWLVKQTDLYDWMRSAVTLEIERRDDEKQMERYAQECEAVLRQEPTAKIDKVIAMLDKWSHDLATLKEQLR